jgi:hypothetical protein
MNIHCLISTIVSIELLSQYQDLNDFSVTLLLVRQSKMLVQKQRLLLERIDNHCWLFFPIVDSASAYNFYPGLSHSHSLHNYRSFIRPYFFVSMMNYRGSMMNYRMNYRGAMMNYCGAMMVPGVLAHILLIPHPVPPSTLAVCTLMPPPVPPSILAVRTLMPRSARTPLRSTVRSNILVFGVGGGWLFVKSELVNSQLKQCIRNLKRT